MLCGNSEEASHSRSRKYQLDSSKDYPFVASTEEYERLNEQSAALNELMHQRISHAPVKSPSRILDIGCRTGIQTVLLAQLYPEAEVIGVDPSPVPASASPKPSNVTYIQGKFEDLVGCRELLQPGSFDLIYQRYLVMIVKDWPGHLKQLRSLLRPGGWLECQECSFYVDYDANEQLISERWKSPSVIFRGTSDLGFDLRVGSKLKDLFHDAGFLDVASTFFPHPYRPGWKERPETDRVGRYVLWASPPGTRLLIRRAAEGAEQGEDPEVLIKESVELLGEGPIGTHKRCYVVVGRKPE